ncbi:radical SAM/SPASM domain-containing protein [Methylocystis sp.]|uniref:radical SAM/SPASM domain-containing protein n=1 Tax=Methylocystis sp. TaxID=1911079 RepID=UPI0027335AF2|nr:radical SAM protein [Methylocystis sp.]MDP3552446.1 radical SAM protein [Methylocystis sp.]
MFCNIEFGCISASKSFEFVKNAIKAISDCSKYEYARTLDSLAEVLLPEALAGYPSETYAKLMILRICNILMLKHASYHGHLDVASMPLQLLLDPANTCQLQCPGCVHSPSLKDRFDWNTGVMSEKCYEKLSIEYAPFAMFAGFFNYGEPLINKRLPSMISDAKALCLYTAVSSNLSLSFDIDALVASGLDYLTMSIDGASQSTLERYRRRAKWDLIRRNMERLVESKRRQNSKLRLRWQFLTFDHNLHEVEEAIELAKNIGLDEIHVGPPFDVSWDDPNIKCAESKHAGFHIFTEDVTRTGPFPDAERLENYKELVNRDFDLGWMGRINAKNIKDEMPAARQTKTCDWLYYSITVDANERVLPCCAPPVKERNLVFGDIWDSAGINAADFKLARMAFSDRESYRAESENLNRKLFCADCPGSDEIQFDRKRQLPSSLYYLDKMVLLDHAAILALAK